MLACEPLLPLSPGKGGTEICPVNLHLLVVQIKPGVCGANCNEKLCEREQHWEERGKNKTQTLALSSKVSLS